MFSRRTAWKLVPNRLAIALEQHRRAGKELLDLTAANPTTIALNYDQQAVLGALAHADALAYRPEPKGLPSARRAVSDYYGEQRIRCKEPSDAAVDPEAIILTVSTSEAYSYVFRLLCDPGDEVLVPTPSYPLFEFLAGIEDVKLVPYALFYDHGWHLDFHSLESAVTPRSRAIILVHPNNPTGSYIKGSEREALNRVCARHELALVVDEVFLDYKIGAEMGETGADEPEIRSFAFNRDALTFTLSGVSKISGLPQMKLAWVVTSGPQALVEAARSRLEIIADTYLSQNAPVQLAAPVLLQQRHNIGAQLRARVRANLSELDQQLAAQLLCSRLKVEGGWYAILRVPAVRTDEQLCLDLLEKAGVLVQPGYFYDLPQDGYLVVSLITPPAEFQEGIQRLLALISRL